MNSHPKILDITGTSDINDFSFSNQNLFYSLGSLLISHNLKSNTKTFINYHQSPIKVIKLINNDSQMLSIDNSPFLVMWDIPSFKILGAVPINIPQDMSIEDIYLKQIKRDKYLLLLSSPSKSHMLYEFNSDSFDLVILCNNISQISSSIIDFGTFFNSNDMIIMLNNTIQYYHFSFDTIGQIKLTNNINFPFRLIKNSMRVSNVVNLICFLTEKGNCLLYDQNANGKPSIIPTEQEVFTASEFSGDTLICGTDNGKIYGFSIYEYRIKFCINGQIMANIKENFLFGINKEEESTVNSPGIERMFIDEQSNLILIKNNDNSIFLSPFYELIDNKAVNPLYSFSHYDTISHIEPAPFDGDIIFYTSSLDQSIQFYVSNGDKIQNYYFDIEKINNKSYNNFQNNRVNKTYITVTKFHPLYSNKLFCGDNKGALYLFDTKEKVFQYKKYIVGTFSITHLSFNQGGDLICIGFDTGMSVICDLNRECEYKMKLSEHYLSPNDIELRKMNNQTMSYSYFLTNPKDNKRGCVVIYMKSLNDIEISTLLTDNDIRIISSNSIKIYSEILDLKIHSSESHSISLVEDMQIVINQLTNGEVTAVIDLKEQVDYAYNLSLDPSGLYLTLICDIKGRANNEKKSNLILFEIGTGKVECVINDSFPMNQCAFDNRGIYLGISGTKGNFSLWMLNKEISMAIMNVIELVKNDPDFWEQYEIKYDNNDYDIDTYYKRNKVISNTNNQRNEEVQVNSRSLNVHKEAKSSLSLSDHGEEDKNNNNERDIKKHFIDIKDIKSIHSGNTNTNIKEVNRNQIEKEILSDNPKKEENIFEQNLMNAPVMQSFQKRKEENQENINQLKDELMNPNKQRTPFIFQSKSYLNEPNMHEFSQVPKPNNSYRTEQPYHPHNIIPFSKVPSMNQMNSLNATGNRFSNYKDSFTQKNIPTEEKKFNEDKINKSKISEHKSIEKEHSIQHSKIEQQQPLINISKSSRPSYGQKTIKPSNEINKPVLINPLNQVPSSHPSRYINPIAPQSKPLTIQPLQNLLAAQKEIIQPPSSQIIPPKEISITDQPNKSRYDKISKAINEMLSSTSTKKEIQNKENNIRESLDLTESEIVNESIDKMSDIPKNPNPNTLKFSKQTFAGANLNTSTEYFINNTKKVNSAFENKIKYPEPEDIDDDMQRSVYNTIQRQNITKSEYSISYDTSSNNQRSNITDDIDYISDNIKNFEERNHIK